MSKRIKPNAEHRIVDGDVVKESIDEKIQRGKEYSQAKGEEKAKLEQQTQTEVDTEKTDDQTSENSTQQQQTVEPEQAAKKSFWQSSRGFWLWLILFAAVIATLFYTRPNTDWQVQKINDLQAQISHLNEKNQSLESKISQQQSELEGAINTIVAPENKPVISQADLDALKNSTDAELSKLQQNLQSLTEQAAKELDQALKQLNNAAEGAKQELQPSDQQLQQLGQLEQKLQSELQGMAGKLSELFAFKDEQQALTKQPPVLQLDMPLDSLQIQQWIVEINTQWILNGRVDETRQQLLALEQAVSLSDFSYTSQLARLIGEDLGYLKRYKQELVDKPLPSTADLKNAATQLAKPNQPDSQPEETSEQKGLDGLLDKFSQMITLKKRTDNSIDDVDNLLSNDVLLQRLGLLIDRLDWGLRTQSPETIFKAQLDIKAFINRHYSSEQASFENLLKPFEQVEFASKQPLAIMKLDQMVAE